MKVDEEAKGIILNMHRDVLESIEHVRREVLRLLTFVSQENRDTAVISADHALYFLERIKRDLEDEEEGLGLYDE